MGKEVEFYVLLKRFILVTAIILLISIAIALFSAYNELHKEEVFEGSFHKKIFVLPDIESIPVQNSSPVAIKIEGEYAVEYYSENYGQIITINSPSLNVTNFYYISIYPDGEFNRTLLHISGPADVLLVPNEYNFFSIGIYDTVRIFSENHNGTLSLIEFSAFSDRSDSAQVMYSDALTDGSEVAIRAVMMPPEDLGESIVLVPFNDYYLDEKNGQGSQTFFTGSGLETIQWDQIGHIITGVPLMDTRLDSSISSPGLFGSTVGSPSTAVIKPKNITFLRLYNFMGSFRFSDQYSREGDIGYMWEFPDLKTEEISISVNEISEDTILVDCWFKGKLADFSIDGTSQKDFWSLFFTHLNAIIFNKLIIETLIVVSSALIAPPIIHWIYEKRDRT